MKSNQYKRNRKEISEAQIIRTFELNGLEPTKELVEFELKYGGLILPAGLEEIEFGIIWGGGFPFNPELAIVEYEESESADHRYDIKCARTQYQMDFTLDENGRYYEDYELMHNSFDELINKIEKENNS